jgi:hypothetical protein
MKRNVIIKWSLLLLFALIIRNASANGWVKDAPIGVGNIFSTPKSGLTYSDDSGFYALVGNSDTDRVLCGTDTCTKSGFTIVKYNTKGNVIWKKPFYPNQDLLQLGDGIICGISGQISFPYFNKSYNPTFIENTIDSSGLIIKYVLDGLTWGYCGCIGSDCFISGARIGTFYAKFDYDGNVIWSQKEIDNNEIFAYSYNNLEYQYFNTYELKIPNYIKLIFDRNLDFTISDKTFNSNLDSVSMDFDSIYTGINIDTTIYYNNVNSSIQKILKTSDKGLLLLLSIGLQVRNPYSQLAETYLLKLNSNNEKEWIQKTPIDVNGSLQNNLIELNNKYYFAFRDGYIDTYSTPYNYSRSKTKLFSIDANGNNATLKMYDNDMSFVHLRSVNNTLQLIGMSNGYTDGNNDNQLDYSVLFFQFDNNDSATIIKEVNMSSTITGNTKKTIYEEPVIDLKNGSSVFGFLYENASNPYNSKHVLVNIDSIGNVYTTKISGTIFGDKNDNCTIENSDAFLRNYSLRAISQTDSFYTSTDTLGNYEMYLDTGSYQLQLLLNPSYPLWKLQDCSIPTAIQLNDGDSAIIDIGLTPTISCTNLTVSLSAPILRRCFENTYYVNYCNNGTVNANNAYIDVTLDHFLDFNASSQVFTNLGNNVFRFQVGNVETGKCGAFSFTATVNCDSTILGQTHCTEAHIFPDSVCSPRPYVGAIIQASATCKTNKVEFKLKNIGGNMQTDRKYIVIQDQVLRSLQNYNLPSGNELIVDVPLVSGATYRIEAEQPADFPSYLGDAKTAAFIEGCRTNSTDTFATGIISQFPLYDGEPFRAVDCQQNRGSYDPNEKETKPIGVGTQHFIDKNIPLDYTIRFQNTGTDTAFTVSIIDTISSYLDINSMVLEASSHACRMIRMDTNVVQFLFEDIKLVDSTKNLNASNGFVQFHIQQKNNNALGTIINNNASIYFDYNPAIFTNTVFHTIGENYLRVDLISSTKKEAYKNMNIAVFPNPFHDKTSLQIKNVELKNPRLILLDVTGKMVDEMYSTTKNEITIYRNQLNAGIYFYQLFDDKIEVATGKIIVQ